MTNNILDEIYNSVSRDITKQLIGDPIAEKIKDVCRCERNSHPGRPYIRDGEVLYSDPRVLTIYEILIVSSLPLDWPIPTWANESLIRKVIGEGIPSKLIKVIVEQLIKQL